MTPEFDEEVVFEVGAGATRGGLGPCLSAPRRGVAPWPPGAVCARRAQVTVGREAGAGPCRGQRLPGAAGGGREPAGPAGQGGARRGRREGVGCPALRSRLGASAAPLRAGRGRDCWWEREPGRGRGRLGRGRGDPLCGGRPGLRGSAPAGLLVSAFRAAGVAISVRDLGRPVWAGDP